MELLCPHCLKKVTVSDDKAGQVLNCPLCQGVFAAPALPPATMRTAPPPSPPLSPPPPLTPAPFSVQPLEPLPPPITTPVTAGQPKPTPPPSPKPPPADYSRKFGFQLRPDILVCFAPVCLFLMVFVLSFFDWHSVVDRDKGLSMWSLGFGDHYTGPFMAYDLFIPLTFLASVACALLELRVIPTPPPLAMLLPWKSGIPFLLLLLTFVLFGYDYQQGLFASTAFGNPILLGEKLAFRLHLLALITTGLELWVQSRGARNLPLPRITVKL
jgi:hypothetical protein